jgi:predicted nucleic acid-binding protein
MMRAFFIDAWYVIALWDRFDGHHFAARRLEKFVATAPLITHDGVLSEILTYFSGAGVTSRQRAVLGVRELLRGARVVSVTRELFVRSLDLYAARPDKGYSLVDCTSMIVMRDLGVNDILTNDHHFRQEKFIVLSDVS